jgi:phosphorylase kinase alpha/beta subunit
MTMLERKQIRDVSASPSLRTSPHIEERLDHYYTAIKQVLLSRQDAVSGLLPASTAVNVHGNYTDAWVRDNVYSILAVWGLGIAYRKLDWDHGRTYELEQSVVKTMRGLLCAMMRQSDKVERFKQTQSPLDALHAKYDTRTGGSVVGDAEWGHLQIDATSLFLLMLGQMTSSGLSIVYTIDEVNFVQNLVYYIGRAYRISDYGVWERGNKINRGDPELNASSVGMAKAALEALSGLDLFGIRGSQASVLHVLSDEVARSRITLESLLPWESCSKEVDAALLSIVGYPAFAIEDVELANRTKSRVIEKLMGRYGCKRFLRDGHQTAIEDVGRLHYEAWELQQFEHIECEWPLFYVYLYLDALFRDDAAAVDEYRQHLKSVVVERDGLELLPELYYVPSELVEVERKYPQTQKRLPNANLPLVWAQSLYYLAQMVDEQLLQIGEIDPLGRRLQVGHTREPVVQVALLAEDESLQFDLEAQGVATQTPKQIEPIQVRLAGELSLAYKQIGRNDNMGLTGRPVRRLRSLTTSKVFLIRGQLMLFLPSFLDPQKFYLMLDRQFLVAQMRSELTYIRRHWRQMGRPTVTLLLTRALMDTGRDALLDLIEEMKSGDCGGVRVRLGRIGELRQMSGVERIDYLHDFEFSEAPVTDAVPETYRLVAVPKFCAPLNHTEALIIEQDIETNSLINRLYRSKNIYEQIEILHALYNLHGADYSPEHRFRGASVTIEQLLEDVYAQAGRGGSSGPYWSVVRHAAALLDKTDVSVSDAVTDILVRQKQITVGKSYSDASLISRPLPPSEIREKIREFGGVDVRDCVLTQEILIYLGLLIRQEPKRFRELITLRVGYLILLMSSELAVEQSLRQEEAHEKLMQLSPSEIQSRLRDVLGDYGDKQLNILRQEALPLESGILDVIVIGEAKNGHDKTNGTDWLRYRQREGSLNRVPPGFYSRVWNLLKHCDGLIIGDKLDMRNRLDSSSILAEMTDGEKNFALWVEHLLNKMDAAKFRQANIEALTALSDLIDQNPSLKINDYLVLDVIVGHAVRLAWHYRHPDRVDDYNEDKPTAWTDYYKSSPQRCATFVLEALKFLTGPEQPRQESV